MGAQLPADSAPIRYVMTARVRLLFFWTQGDVRRLHPKGILQTDPRQGVASGSCSARSCQSSKSDQSRGSGNEGSAQEARRLLPWRRDTSSSAFWVHESSRKENTALKCRKSSEGEDHVKTCLPAFSAVLTPDAPSPHSAAVLGIDYNLHQYAQDEPIMLRETKFQQLASARPGKLRRLRRAGELLGTVSD